MGVEFKNNASKAGKDQLHGGTDNKEGTEWSQQAIDFASKELGEIDLGDGLKGSVEDLFEVKGGKKVLKDKDAADTLNKIVDDANGKDNIWGEGDKVDGAKKGLKGYLDRHKSEIKEERKEESELMKKSLKSMMDSMDKGGGAGQ